MWNKGCGMRDEGWIISRMMIDKGQGTRNKGKGTKDKEWRIKDKII